MKLYGRRRHYRRLRPVRASEEPNDRISIVKRRPVWKVRVNRRLQLRLSKSMVVLRSMRDSYVELMFCFAARLMQFNNGNVHLVKKIGVSIGCDNGERFVSRN